LDPSVALHMRWLGAIYFKNSGQSHWRRTTRNHISDEEKSQIRSRCFDNLNEPLRQLNSQVASTIAKIARVDFPREWPDLFDRISRIISEAIDENNLVVLHNALYILNQVLKQLASMKVGRTRSNMQEHVPGLLNLVGGLYVNLINDWTQSVDLAKMEVGYLALKACSRLMYDGYEYSNRAAEARCFFETAYNHLGAFLGEYENRPSHLLAKYIIQIGKLYVRLFDNQAAAFVLMPRSLQVLQLYLSIVESKAPTFHNDDEEDDCDKIEIYQNVVIQGFELLKGMIHVVHKASATTIRFRTEDERAEAKAAQTLLKAELFTQPILSQLTNIILSWCLRLNQSDIECWRSDPEEFFVEEIQISPEYHLRPCAASLFENLIVSFRDEIGGQVLSFIENTLNMPSQTMDEVALKDSALYAFEVGYSVFLELCDFETMVKNVFVAEAKVKDDNYRIIRRRLGLVLSEWISHETAKEVRNEIYTILVGFLDEDDPLNDVVVRLYTVQALKYCIDSYGFEVQGFLPFADAVILGIMRLLKSLEAIETKSVILNAISVFVEQLGHYVTPYIETILSILPPLWSDSIQNQQINGVILHTLSNIIAAAGGHSVNCYPLAIPALRVSIDPSSELHAYLFEDALPLWKALVENAESSNSELLSLTGGLLHLLENSTENLAAELEILESYVVLSPDELLTQEYMTSLFSIFAQYVPFMTQHSLCTVAEALTLITAVKPASDYLPAFYESNLLNTLLDHLFDKEQVTTITAVRIYSVFSRMVFSNPSLFWEMMDASDRGGKLLDCWLKRFDNMGHPRDRKMNGLGLASLLGTGQEVVLNRLARLINIWCELLDEINETAGDSEAYYGASDFVDTDEAAQQEMSPDAKRRQLITRTRDPVHCVPLKSVVKSNVESLQHLSGEKRALVESLDPTLLQLLHGFTLEPKRRPSEPSSGVRGFPS
jgi:hypothetical protein